MPIFANLVHSQVWCPRALLLKSVSLCIGAPWCTSNGGRAFLRAGYLYLELACAEPSPWLPVSSPRNSSPRNSSPCARRAGVCVDFVCRSAAVSAGGRGLAGVVRVGVGGGPQPRPQLVRGARGGADALGRGRGVLSGVRLWLGGGGAPGCLREKEREGGEERGHNEAPFWVSPASYFETPPLSLCFYGPLSRLCQPRPRISAHLT